MPQTTGQWMRRSERCLSSALPLALSIALLNLSPQCGFAADKPRQTPISGTDAAKKAASERPPFDLTYVPQSAMGVIAIRPSAIFADPAMKPLAGMANQGLAQLRQFLKLSTEPKLAIEDIEEVIALISITVGDKKHGRNHSLIAGPTMIRTTHDFDWLKLMRQLDPKTEEVRHGDRVYYRYHLSRLSPGSSPKATCCFFMPDKRTLAFLVGKSASAFVNGESIQRPHLAWEKDWKRVECGLIAVAIDNRWAHGLSKEEIGCEEPVWTSLAQNASTMVAGVDWKNGINFQASISCKDRVSGDQIVKDVKTLLADLRDATVEAPKDAPGNERKADAFHLQLCKDLADHAHIKQHETAVRVHTTAKINLIDFAKFFFLESTHATPKK